MTTTYREILASIVRVLRTIPGEAAVQTQDVKEGFVRPSFFVGFHNIVNSNHMKNSKIRNITMKVVYFPSDDKINQVELLEMMDDLEKVFVDSTKITVLEDAAERHPVIVETRNTNFSKTNDIIEMFFDIDLDERLEIEKHEFDMEELEISEEKF